MSRRALALALGVGGLALAAALVARQQGVVGLSRPRVALVDATAADLDTVTVRGRIVQASVGGTVAQVDGDGEVWVWAGGDAFPLRFDEPPALAVEDRVLATGRVRARRGRRWLDVASWVRVEPAVETPPAPAP